MNNREEVVLKYVMDHDHDPLHYNQEIEYHPGKTTMRMLVFRIMDMSTTQDSLNPQGVMETRHGKRRSALDIWRHVINYRPKATIFWVMRIIWKLHYEENILAGQFCQATQRRVFRLKANVPFGYSKDMFHESDLDEFHLRFMDWKTIGKEEELE